MSYDFDNNFKHHAPKEGQAIMFAAIRLNLKEAAEFLDALCPDSREKSLAFTKLEEAMFWANASIARTGHVVSIGETNGETLFVDEEAVVDFTHKKTGVDKDTIRTVFEAEAGYLTELGIIREGASE
jgi:hypothetical protein